jgi:TetR/AcrR family transcriptional regulator, regulator of cefoperazone and chloramphenicol sensitivity
MDHKEASTREVLLETAGRLFAEFGVEGTSVRRIAEVAGTNLAAINYHFGSKENLHREVLMGVLDHEERCDARHYAAQEGRFNTPEDIAALIYEMVNTRLMRFFAPDEPEWHAKLVMRALLEPTDVLENIVRERFRPDLDALGQIFRRARPGLTDEEASLYADSFLAHLSFYGFAQSAIFITRGFDGKYPPDFLHNVARHVARMLVTCLGLPVPGDEDAVLGYAVKAGITEEHPHG